MKRVIFLDTNVFESAKFSYDSRRMEAFLDACDEKSISLYITDVVKHEVVKRIRANIQSAIESIDNKHSLAILINSLEAENLEKIKLIKSLSDKLIQDFEGFISDYDITEIPSNFDQTKLLELYFSNNSPFSVQKKHEFPDAIILLTIKQWSERNSKKPLFISNDKGMSDFCEEESVQLFNQISDVTDLLLTENPNDDLLERYNELLSEVEEEIITNIKAYNDFELYSYDSIDDVEVDSVKVKSVTINKIDIINLDREDCVIQLEIALKIEFSLNASYPDMDTMSRDKEDGINYFCLYNYAELNVKEATACYLEVRFDRFDIDESGFEIDNLKFLNNEFEFELDESNIINIKQYEKYSSIEW